MSVDRTINMPTRRQLDAIAEIAPGLDRVIEDLFFVMTGGNPGGGNRLRDVIDGTIPIGP